MQSMKLNVAASSRAFLENRTITVNPASGKRECVFADLESMYPNGPDEGEEFSFEELRARNRGLLGRCWSPVEASPLTVEPEQTCHLDLPLQESSQPVAQLVQLNDMDVKPAAPSRKQDEKANRTRKIHVMEVRAETQTSKRFMICLNLLTCQSKSIWTRPPAQRSGAGRRQSRP